MEKVQHMMRRSKIGCFDAEPECEGGELCEEESGVRKRGTVLISYGSHVKLKLKGGHYQSSLC